MRVTILGAGKSGTAIARQSLLAGHEVSLSSRAAPEELARLLEFVAPGAVALPSPAALRDSDIIVLAVPLSQHGQLAVRELSGATVIDAMNYWPPVDGFVPEFSGTEPSSRILQGLLPETRVAKSLNHVGYAELEPSARARGARDRRALVVASDDAAALSRAAGFVDSLGFDPIAMPGLDYTYLIEPGGSFFGAALTRQDAPRVEAAIRQHDLLAQSAGAQ